MPQLQAEQFPRQFKESGASVPEKIVEFNSDLLREIERTGIPSLNLEVSPNIIRVAEQQVRNLISEGMSLNNRIAQESKFKQIEDEQAGALKNFSSDITEQFKGGLYMIERAGENEEIAKLFKGTDIGAVIRKRLREKFVKTGVLKNERTGAIEGLPVISKKMKVNAIPESRTSLYSEGDYFGLINSEDRAKEGEVRMIFPDAKTSELTSVNLGKGGEIIYGTKKEDGSEEIKNLYQSSSDEEKKKFLELFIKKMEEIDKDISENPGEHQRRYAALEAEKKELIEKYNRLRDPRTVEEAIGIKRPEEMGQAA